MTHQLVQPGRLEGAGFTPVRAKNVQRLLEAEQFEVAEQEAGQQGDDPAEPVKAVDQPARRRCLDIPKGQRDRLPEQEHQAQRQAAEQHIGGPFDGGRYPLQPE
ncbi:hypothetical protein D3C84_797110 [compost metagenome]